MELGLYPFSVLKKYAIALVIPLIPIIFLIGSSYYVTEGSGFEDVSSLTGYYFGSNVSFAASDLTQYDEIGANGLIPIMRLGGIAKDVEINDIKTAYHSFMRGEVSIEFISLLIIFITLFLGYLTFAMVSRIIFAIKSNKKPKFGIEGINPATIALSFCAAVVVLLFSSFSMDGFELVLLLNFGVFFALSIPSAAAGLKFGESLFDAFDFIKFNFGALIVVYLLSIGVAIAAQIGLLIVFMFPLSTLDQSIVPMTKIVLSLFGINFALFFQYVICSRSVYDFSKIATKAKVPSLRRMAKRVR